MEKKKKRITSVVAQRYVNMKLLLDTLEAGQHLDRDDISELLGIGPSGARKYINELRSENVVEVAAYVDSKYANVPRRAIYKISSNPLFVTAFKQLISEYSLPSGNNAGLSPQKERNTALSGRNIHFCTDDAPVHIPANQKVPKQWDILAQFYGMRVEA